MEIKPLVGISSAAEPWLFRFRDLMPFVVRDILLVTSLYDAFILEEDGPLMDKLFADYSELALLMSPRIFRADSIDQALKIMSQRKIDLIISSLHFEDIDINVFAKSIKNLYPYIPIVLLLFSESDLLFLPDTLNKNLIEQVFLWSGNARILFAILKYIEDKKNADHDVKPNGVRVLLVVEDSPKDYSAILENLYSELLSQSQLIMADASNTLHRMIRLRSRPKILLANTFEEAQAYCEKFLTNIHGIITDAKFFKGSKLYKYAGIDFIKWVRSKIHDVPILLESGEPDMAHLASEVGVHFVNKNAEDLLRQIKNFLQVSLGFGDFIFRLPNEREIARARNLREMENVLATIDLESLYYHASRHNFSTWLNARSMFEEAALLKKYSVTEFSSMEEVRDFLVQVIRQARLKEEEGWIAEFSPKEHGDEKRVIRLGFGSTGGKGRGIAFVNTLLASDIIPKKIEGMEIQIPRTLIICTSWFERFLAENNIMENLKFLVNDDEIRAFFMKCQLPRELMQDLRMAMSEFDSPIAIRSSGLLEDSRFLPFAGIYDTYLLPNSHRDLAVRFRHLLYAIKAVYASTFCENAKSFINNTKFRIEDEKMAIVIQKVIGRKINNRFYPDISGVALSYNFYNIEPLKPEDGIAIIALGLGHTVVEGRSAFRFCPVYPHILPQFGSPIDYVRLSQNGFYALDLSDFPDKSEELLKTSFLKFFPLSVAEEDGSLQYLSSVYCVEDDSIKEDFHLSGPRAVTFNNILKWQDIPLAQAINIVLQSLRKAMGSAVEIEFAVDLKRHKPNSIPVLYVLQVRPVSLYKTHRKIFDVSKFEKEKLICYSTKSLGHGIIANVYDLIFVKVNTLNSSISLTIVQEIAKITNDLRSKASPFILIGPGRWGSSDSNLGIPVEWSHISGVKLIVETALVDKVVEPSEGMHFFHNLTSLGIGYVMIANNHYSKDNDFIDKAWLQEQEAIYESEYIKHIKFKSPIIAYFDGPKKSCVIIKPGNIINDYDEIALISE